MREVLIVAGEDSGDLHGAELVRALKRARPDLHLVGVGGDRMAAAGLELLEHTRRMAVMGFAEVVRQVPHHWALLRRLRERLDRGNVALTIPIDYPGFNMKLAAASQARGVPVLYYITPQVWAWGAGRLPKLAALVTKAATILPFEAPLLQAHGIDATFVGHPLLDRLGTLPSRAEAREMLELSPNGPVLALFPGSRKQELDRHLSPFVETAQRLQGTIPGLVVVVSGASTVHIDPVACPYRVIPNASFAILRAADAALCKSGTTTLEAAVAGCPLVVAYRTSGWTYAIAKRAVKIPHIGLVNVVAGREVAPEFIQDGVQPSAMSATLGTLLRVDSPQRAAMLEELARVKATLGGPGASERTAALAAELAR